MLIKFIRFVPFNGIEIIYYLHIYKDNATFNIPIDEKVFIEAYSKLSLKITGVFKTMTGEITEYLV